MAELTREDRRRNRKTALEALRSETGSSGGDVAGPRVRAYCDDPLAAPTTEFAYVGALKLVRFYVDPAMPNAGQRRTLWAVIRRGMNLPVGAVPAGWDGSSDVSTLQQFAEETP